MRHHNKSFKHNYYCNLCKEEISNEEAKYSKENYGDQLCRNHQKSIKSVNRYNKKITSEARDLGFKLMERGVPLEFEKYDRHKHIDIAIVQKKVNIEVDGKHHNLSKKQALSDLKRTYHSFKKGYLTLRIPNSLVKDKKTIEETAKYIVAFLKER